MPEMPEMPRIHWQCDLVNNPLFGSSYIITASAWRDPDNSTGLVDEQFGITTGDWENAGNRKGFLKYAVSRIQSRLMTRLGYL